jgi:hypothetical protein
MVGQMRHHANDGREIRLSLRHACAADGVPDVVLAELSRAVALPAKVRPAPASLMRYPAGRPFIAAQHQPALVLDYACSRELADGALLRGRAWRTARCRPRKATLRRAIPAIAGERGARLDSADTSFMLGQQMLPGHTAP